MKDNARLTFLARLAALLFAVGISVLIYMYRDQAPRLAAYGYPGVFVLSFVAYATVFLPAPGVAAVFTLGAVLNPVGVGLAAGAGAALGEVVGYLAGISSRTLTDRSEKFQKLVAWMRKYDIWAVMLLSAIPNPAFDLAGAAAGALKMPFWHFLLSCWVGETIKMLFFALAGAGLFRLFF